MQYDIIIIGGGPAGVAAAVYAARKKLKTLVITEKFGGQSAVSANIQNWIGESSISGITLAKKLEDHVRSYSDDIEIKTADKVVKVTTATRNKSEHTCDFEVKTDKGNRYTGKTLLVASGARRRKLNIPGEAKFEGTGVAYCSTCDAPAFMDKKVVVIGGGNAGLEALQDLFPYVKEVYILEYSDKLNGDPIVIEEVKKNLKLKEIILNAKTLEIFGDQLITGIRYQDRKTKEEKELLVDGVFVEIGSIPNSEIVNHLVQTDKWEQVIIDSKHGSTSHPGIFAAGDVTDDPYKQNNISVGDAVKAMLAAYAYLQNRGKQTLACKSSKISSLSAP